MSSPLNRTSASEVFAIVQQISSQINNDGIQDIVESVNGLKAEDNQLVVDLLGIVLEKSHHLLKNADRVLLMLAKIASSVNVLARNRTISFEYIAPDAECAPDMYRILHESPIYVKVVRRGKKGATTVYDESLMTWAHLSHTNILPVYGAFLEGEGGPISLISIRMMNENIVDHAKTLSQAARMLLISDIISGLCYLHQLNVVHGALTPQSVCISEGGHACIADLDARDSDLSTIRYSAPEILKDEDLLPTRAADMWSLGCLCYEVLSGKVPFYQHRQERKVSVAIVTGKQPTRPGQEEVGADDIGDIIWHPLSSLWEFGAEDRPNCSQFQQVFSSIIIRDDRSVLSSTIPPEILERAKTSALNLDQARSIFGQLLGSDQSISPPSQIPEELQIPLFGLVDNLVKAEAVVVAAKKLHPDDTQILVDVLDLVWKEIPTTPIADSPIDRLLSKIMVSTHVFPQRYKINRLRYDSTPIAEGDFGKVYKGHDLDVCVSVITSAGSVSEIVEYCALWAHSSHPNVLPFYAIFLEGANEIPRFCLVMPYMKNGLLHDYAPRLPQKDRLPLLSDAIDALIYLEELNFLCDVNGSQFVISDEGRALVITLGPEQVLKAVANMGAIRTLESYALRFFSPEKVKGDNSLTADVISWSFGCLLYEVLSGNLPYYQYTSEDEIRAALSRGEALKRPSATNSDIDEINDQFWDLIMQCCALDSSDRLTFLEIQRLLRDMGIQDNRHEATSLPGAEVQFLKSPPEINWDGVNRMLDQIQVELLRTPLSKLLQNHTKDVAVAVAQLKRGDTRTFVDFLDLALKNHITLSDERNRVLALLSRITSLTQIFPLRYELKGITYHSPPFAGGSFGAVHRGISDPNICVKVMVKVDSKVLMDFVKELILWAHASHPNVLPFYGVFVDDLERICLVSPFMNNGNLHNYAPRLSQKNRIPLLHDVIKGLVYLHGLGIVHTDLKGENVLISNEGRALITDFGASHVITSTAKGGATAASIASTLRFTAPEIVLDRHLRPTQECDIWSFGCLCYEVLSRQLPYFEYNLEAQIYTALIRGQLPKRPSTNNNSADDGDDWEEFDEPDWDEIDDPAWNLITRCCAPKPEVRPGASRIRELIVDLKMWDTRLEAIDTPGNHLLFLRSNPDVNLNRVGELLNELQVHFLAQSTLSYSTRDVISAIERLKLEEDSADAAVEFCDLVVKDHLFTSDENNRALALLSALICTSGIVPYRYLLRVDVRYKRASIGNGGFGIVHHGSDPNICVKVTYVGRLYSDLKAQWHKALAPSVYSLHPNVLPLYGMLIKDTSHGRISLLVLPFMRNGNLHNYAPRLPQTLQILLICDVVEALLYLHSLGITHGNLKGENVLISDEGRALVTDFRPYHINVAAAEEGLTGPYITSTLRFTAPELIKSSQTLPTTKSDIWSVGCLIYLVLSRKVPFYQYSENLDIRSALSRGELPARPVSEGNGLAKIEDSFWELITKCCAPEPDDRLTLSGVRTWLTSLGIPDSRPPVKPLPGAEILNLWDPHPGVDLERIGNILARLKSQLPPITQNEEGEDESHD